MQNRSVNFTQQRDYNYQNPFGAEYYFVEGMGFVPVDPRSYEKQRIRGTGNALGACLLVYFATAVFLAPAVGQIFARLFAGWRFQASESAHLVLQIFVYLCSMALPFSLYKRMVRIPLRAAFPFRKGRGLFVGCGVGAALACSVLGAVISTAVGVGLSAVGGRPYYAQSGPTLRPLPLLLYFLYSCILVPVMEELVFRGLVLQSLRPYGDTFALFSSAVLFGLMHLSPVQQPNAFLLGLVIGYFTLVSGSLFTGMVMHAAVNLVAYFFTVLELCLPAQVCTGVGYGAYILLLLAGLISVMVYMRRAKEGAFLLRRKTTYLLTREKNRSFYTAPCMVMALVVVFGYMVSFL
ncbi:MAG: CPBP family intramembrane metalloprotease [Oscillospiraceae bacterium]|jgi:membrane protease YdiL (CAAX protease family)|nr:CPBP family intramembrane metalloprotease [Oscillospiraceae bacterium]